MSSRPLVAWIAVSLVACIAWLWLHHAPASEASVPGDARARGAPASAAELALVEAALREAAPGTHARGSAAAEVARIEEDALKQRLEALARLEVQLARSAGNAIDEALQRELEELLRPLLADPSVPGRILAHLAAGDWYLAAAEEAQQLSLAEWGGTRALYWALASFHTVASPFHDLERGRALLTELLATLPRIEHALTREWLLRQLAAVLVDGQPLLLWDPSYFEGLLRMRAAFPDQRAAFSALFAGLGDSLAPEERDRLFGALTGDVSDPVLLGTALRNLLRGQNPLAALALARALFDDPRTPVDARRAIAEAVASALEDPFEAARFLAERVGQLPDMLAAFGALGASADGFAGLDSEYSQLAAGGSNAAARELAVFGMGVAAGDHSDRLREIARSDPDARVRGQALLSLTSSRDWQPAERDIGDLRAACEAGLDAARAGFVAGNIAGRAQRDGLSAMRDQAVGFLRDLAMDDSLPPKQRRQAAEQLRNHISQAEYAQLLDAIPPG